MAENEKTPEYWEGVFDTLKLIQEFIEWKTEHPDSKRDVTTYLNAALNKVSRQLTTDLRDLIGFGEQSQSDETQSEPVPNEAEYPIEEPVTSSFTENLPQSDPSTLIEMEEPEPLITESIEIPPPSFDEPLKPAIADLPKIEHPIEEDKSLDEPAIIEEESMPSEESVYTGDHFSTPAPDIEAPLVDDTIIPPAPDIEEIELPPPLNTDISDMEIGTSLDLDISDSEDSDDKEESSADEFNEDPFI